MNNDFWIGDTIKLLDEDTVGTFEGMATNDMVKVKINGQHRTTSIHNIIPYELKPSKSFKLDLLPDKNIVQQSKFKTEIDLHIEKLAPKLVNGSPLIIRERQKRACGNFIKQCIEYKVFSAKIIHGKGSGVLKEIVLSELANYSAVLSIQNINNGGGVEVIFNHKKQT